jgi:hypothetical protein
LFFISPTHPVGNFPFKIGLMNMKTAISLAMGMNMAMDMAIGMAMTFGLDLV